PRRDQRLGQVPYVLLHASGNVPGVGTHEADSHWSLALLTRFATDLVPRPVTPLAAADSHALTGSLTHLTRFATDLVPRPVTPLAAADSLPFIDLRPRRAAACASPPDERRRCAGRRARATAS